MSVDVLVSHPRDIYYPYFVKKINQNRKKFNRVLIAMTQSASDRDYTDDLKKAVNAHILTEYKPENDWRNHVIHEMLKRSDATHVLFLEQDFLYHDSFLDEMLEAAKRFPVIGFLAGDRLHPAFLLINRSLLDKTSKDFSAGDGGDHFSKLTKDLEGQNIFLPYEGFYHLAGLTQNYRLTENFYQPSAFYTYNSLCLLYDQPESWKKVGIEKLQQVGRQELDIDVLKFFDKA